MKHLTRCLSILLVICLVASSLAVTASAVSLTYTDEYGTWTYEVEEDGSITLLKCKTVKKNIVIPGTIDGKPVRKLGKHLFQNNDTITGVVIPHGVKEIDKMVFFNCDKLEYVEIPNSVTAIGDQVFSKCESLETLYIPSSVTELGEKVFEDSPKVEVQCPINSETASYLKDNKDEVANYTLIEVTPQNPAPQPQPGVTPDSSGSAVINGKLVTYTFGKMINGKPEFTFVVADSMPDLDLMHYVAKDENGVAYGYLSEEVQELMNSRFQLVSMSRYDGKTTDTVDLVKLGAVPFVEAYIENYLDEAGMPQSDVLYNVVINNTGVGYTSRFPMGLEFNSDNEMLTYATNDPHYKGSMVKEEDTYTYYEATSGPSACYEANGGALIMASDQRTARVHRFGVQGDCVAIVIIKNAYQETAAAGFENLFKEVTICDSDEKNVVDASVSVYAGANGIRERQTTSYVEKKNGALVDSQSYEFVYDGQGNLMTTYAESQVQGAEGTYEVTKSVGKVTERWSVNREEYRSDPDGNNKEICIEVACEDVNRVYSSEYVVRAENIDDAMSQVPQDFPNEPDQRRDFVSYRNVNTVDIHKEQGTETDLNTGDGTPINEVKRIEQMSNYTYIGNTGKFVGWDWSWIYDYGDGTAAANGDCVLTHYRVTEYRYSDDTWTKTETEASAKDINKGSTVDFKNTDSNATITMEQILADYFLSSTSYVFDPDDSGVDNWRLTGSDNIEAFNDEATDASGVAGDVKEQLENMPERMEAISDALLGASGVTDADGNVLNQNEVKDETLEWVEETKEELLEERNFYKEVLSDETLVPDGEKLMDTAEEVFETGDVPEANVDGYVDHRHNSDGTTDTIIGEDNSGELHPEA